MAAQWRSTDLKGNALPSGIRILIPRTAGEPGRVYIRIKLPGDPQRDIRTPWLETDKGAIRRAEIERWHLKGGGELRFEEQRRVAPQTSLPAINQTLPPQTIGGLLDLHFNQWCGATPEERAASVVTVKAQQQRVTCMTHLSNLLGTTTDVHHLTVPVLRKYVVDRCAMPYRPERYPRVRSIIRELKVLKSAIQLGREQGYVNIDFRLAFPTATSFSKGREEGPSEEQQGWNRTDDEVKEFLKALSKQWVRDLCLFSLNTGLRSEEIQRIRVKHFDTRRQAVWITPKARGALPFWLPLRPQALGLMNAAVARLKGQCQPERKLWQPGCLYSYTAIMQRANKKLGLKGRNRIKLRDMRATAGRRIYDRSGGNLEAARVFLRHTTVEMTINYLRLSEAAVAKIDVDTEFYLDDR